PKWTLAGGRRPRGVVNGDGVGKRDVRHLPSSSRCPRPQDSFKHFAPKPSRRSAVMASIDRRRLLKAAGAASVGASAPAVAAPAVAQSSPEIQWRMPVSWPKTLDTLYGGAEQFCKYVAEATDGKFHIRPMLGDERIPALE